jgi:DnaJ-class molecular chaperone
MADDPYKVLGVARDASTADIKRAFHKLAKKWHPDLNPGDAGAEAKFKSITGANELLSDPERRAAFDRGEIDASGQPNQPPPNYRGHAEGAQGGRYRAGPANGGFTEDDLGDIFGDLFGRRGRPAGPASGRDEMYALSVDFLDAVNGATRRLTLPDGRSLDVKVPAGIESGQTLRLRGKGGAGVAGGPAGDALIEVTVSEHPFFRREGQDIHLDLPVTLREAVLGAKINAPTPRGAVALTIPRHSDSGRQLRLRGRGVAAAGGREAGDLYVTLRVTIGTPDTALEDALRAAPETGDDPRRAMMGV